MANYLPPSPILNHTTDAAQAHKPSHRARLAAFAIDLDGIASHSTPPPPATFCGVAHFLGLPSLQHVDPRDHS